MMTGAPELDLTNARSYLSKLREMTNHPKLASSIVQDDTWLGVLVLVLDNEDASVITTTLEILQTLAEQPEHRPRMREFIGMIPQLQDLMHNESQPSHLREQAKKIYAMLQCPEIAEHHADTNCENPSTHEPLRDVKDTSVNQSRAGTKIGQKGRRSSMCVRSSGIAKNAKTIILQIKGMVNRDDLDLCRSLLVQVKGVISITFDFKKKRSILRCRKELRPEALARSIVKSITMTAEQVVKDESGQEVLLSFGAKPAEVNKENESMPDYPSDDSPVKGDTNMARIGDRKRSGNSWGFVKTVGQFLSESFYW